MALKYLLAVAEACGRDVSEQVKLPFKLVEHHYKSVNRPFACCQPRDLMDQVRNFCSLMEFENKMTRETIDFAVENYFSIM